MNRGGRNRKKDKHFLKFTMDECVPGDVNIDPSKPNCTYEIEHVFGFSGDRQKSCLKFGNNNNEIIYPAAALGIVQDLKTRQQKIFGGGEKSKDQPKYVPGWHAHQDDITGLDTAGGSFRNIVATAECGKQATIHLWDINTMEGISSFSLGDKARGVNAVALSPC